MAQIFLGKPKRQTSEMIVPCPQNGLAKRGLLKGILAGVCTLAVLVLLPKVTKKLCRHATNANRNGLGVHGPNKFPERLNAAIQGESHGG
jgi:hypothetical protein